ncbi:nuclear pore complex protein Nup160-like [Bolinopsis microptera]|uniref:nuclear pore complex protein Nup160-like n=1 Tax=Bolinopsis microptera TaxID=2820187 RepID=UPI003078DD48
MLLQGERISREYVQEWVEVGYSFLNDKDTPRVRNFTKDGGAFRYQSSSELCRDRWIIWRIKDDTVELSELSLHLNLSGNGLRLYFPNTTVLSPIMIVEEGLTVSILIATTASVHRIICPHPSSEQSCFNLGTVKTNTASVLESIDTTVLQTKHHFSYIPHDVAPSLATAALTQIGAAVFAFSYPSADLRLVTLPPLGTDAAVLQTDLHQRSLMQSLWSGVSRRSTMVESVSAPLSLTMSQLGPDMLLFSLCKDVKLRVWSVNNKDIMNMEAIPCKTDLKLHGNHSLCFKPATADSTAMIGMHLSFVDDSVFRIYTVLYNNEQLSMTLLYYCSGWDMPLKHFSVTADKILALHDEAGTSRVLTLKFGNSENEGSWEEAQIIEPSELDEEIFDDKECFVQFCLGEFTENTISAALDKLGFEFEEGTVDEALDNFIQTHEAMGDLEETLPALYSECRTFHNINSCPVSISDGILVMAGDLSLLLPNSSDFYVNENSVLMGAFVKLTEFIPATGWELLQDNSSDNLVDIARELLSNHLNPECAAELDELILSMENVQEVLESAVGSIDKYPVSSRQLPTLFRSVTGTECLIRAVDTGVFDAHKTYAVLLVCLVYIEQEQAGVSEETQAKMRTSLIPGCVQIMNRFSLLQWVLSSSVETSPDYDNFGNLNISEVEKKPKTILHHYLSSRHPLIEYKSLEDMKKTVVAIINAMYPGSTLLDLPQFLLSSQYYHQLKEYYTKSGDCSAALKHIAAQAYAATGEQATAVKMFIGVAKNLDMNSPLLTTFIGNHDGVSTNLQYITKCISMLERSGLSAAIVSLATQATQFCEKEHLPLLHSLAFKHAVEAGDYDMAYKALSSNPCPSQKHACLKRFVVVMVEAGQAKRLVNYPYHGFKAEVVSVLEFKARNSDLRQNQLKSYYNLLFAFHVQNKMYQHAAATAYEHVLRLQNELPGVASLQQQLHGYLTAISCLELLRENDAWILEPTQYADVRVAVNASPKRGRSANQPKEKKSNTKLTLVTVKELRAGYLMVDSLVKISAIKPDSVKLHNLSSSEVLGLLCSCGLYDQAFLLASYHDLPPPLGSLTARCVNVAQHFAAHSHLPSGFTDWLALNNVPNTDELNPADRAWLYLQTKVEAHGDWESLRAVLAQMLSAPFPPPFWLLKLCKLVNTEGTIRLCAQYDSLQLAVNLAIGYIGAVAGRETRDFGLENSLQSNMPPVYVPYTVFDQVLLQLKQKTDKSSAELYKDLVEQINSHIDLLERVCEDNTYLNRDKLVYSLT